MRSRILRSVQLSGIAVGVLTLLLSTASVANAAPAAVLAQATPCDLLRAPVGVTAIGLGIVGMVAGAFRKKKVQPENERRTDL